MLVLVNSLVDIMRSHKLLFVSSLIIISKYKILYFLAVFNNFFLIFACKWAT